MPKVSIIIPVYNVGAYLRQCLESVLAQTYRDLEILLVDDGSTDDSGRLCDAYAARDGRIRVIHQVNGGLSDARNAGLDRMTGKYVTFIDSDDYVNQRYVEILTDCAVGRNLDLVIGGYLKFPDGAFFYPDGTDVKEGRLTLYTAREAAIDMLYRRLPMYSHGRLYDGSLFENVRFPRGRIYEDITTTWQILKRTDTIAYVDSPLYYYRQRADSIVRSAYVSRKMDQVIFTKDIMDEVKSDEVFYQAAVFRYFFALADVYAQMRRDDRRNGRYRADVAFLETEIKRYRGSVLRNKKGDTRIRALAAFASVSPRLVRAAGRFYKSMKRNMSWRIR